MGGVWMFVIGQMELALADCTSSSGDDGTQHWDNALAYYSGSLEGPDGAGSGKFLYHLADKRAENYETRFSNATSYVNMEVVQQFRLGKDALLGGDCSAAEDAKNEIVSLMSIPLVQGALRYAYKVGELSGGSKGRAEGDVFTAAILPRINSCSQSTATMLWNNMDYNAATPMVDGFAAVKAAFESVYTCLGFTCADVNCLIEDATAGSCYADFQACSDDDASAALRGLPSPWVGISAAALLAFLIGRHA